jgi:transcriptional regulator with PAS, ATPase and Fis domain
MALDRLVLVSGDDHLGPAIQGDLRRELGHAVLCAPDAADLNLGPDMVALVLVAPAEPAECAGLVRLVQEVRLRQWPAAVVVLEPDGADCASDLDTLAPYLAGRFRWPAQADALFRYLQELPGLVRGRPPSPAPEGSAEEWIVRQLVRQTPSLAPLAERLAVAAAHEVTVLLTGETGTGKTFLARLIHENSPRREHPLLVVPCGALAASLIESELFGHARGAFTGADRAKVGKFEAAGAGTILLDEVDALGLVQQAKLLRVIETGEYEPVGSNDVKVSRARVIAASNWDLERAVAEGRFRQDLYYRLNVFAFYLPPLRQRVGDVAPLAGALVARFAQKFHKGLFAIGPEAVRCLEAFPWPGNIRQLENALQQAVLVSTGPQLLREHLPVSVREPPQPPAVAAAGPPRPAAPGSLAGHRDEQERLAIERALAQADNCRSRAAHALGISRVTLYNKMKKYGLTRRQSPD